MRDCFPLLAALIVLLTAHVVQAQNWQPEWTSATLSHARYGLAAAAAGNEVFFAGGETSAAGGASNVVDVLHLPNYTTISSSSAYTLWLATTVSGRTTLSAPGSLNLATFTLNVGSMSGNAPIDLGSGTLTTGSDNTTTTYAGKLSDAGALVKIGSGKLTLTGSNTYTGPTTINQGSLLVNGSLASPVTVNGGGVLGGTGTLTSAIVNSGGTLAPGNPLGAMSLSGSLTLLSGAKMDYELGASLTGDEVLMPNSTLDLNNQQFSDFDFTTLSGFSTGTYTLIKAGSIIGPFTSSSGAVGGLPATLSEQGSNLVLTVVPEPGTLALAGSLVLRLAIFRWREKAAVRDTVA